MAHDTSASANGYAKAEGAQLLKNVFAGMETYRCIEDAAIRPGEQTHRGLFCATTDPALFTVIESAFSRYCGKEEA